MARRSAPSTLLRGVADQNDRDVDSDSRNRLSRRAEAREESCTFMHSLIAAVLARTFKIPAASVNTESEAALRFRLRIPRGT